MSSSPSAPAAPDPVKTAQAQTASNVDTATAQAALNNVNQNTPYGATSFQQTGSYTTPGGQVIPTYTQNTQLSPLGSTILTGTQGVEAGLIPTAQTLAGQASSSLTNPLNFNTPFSGAIDAGPSAIGATNPNYASMLASGPGSIAATNPNYAATLASGPQNIAAMNPAYASILGNSPQLLNQNVTNAIYGQQKGFLDPQWNQNEQQLQDQLSRQGIGVGSQAYSGAQTQLDNARTQAYQSAQDAAISGGTAASQGLFGMAAQGQQLSSQQQQAAFNAALSGQQQGSAQQQAAFNAALGGQQLSTSQQQAMFNAALQGQQQNISQQQLAQTNPLSNLQALFGATPPSPQQPIGTPNQTGISPTNTIAAQQLSTDAQNAAFQAKLQASNANTGALAGVAGTAIGAGIIAI
jgi:hypothetical protein